MIEIKTFTFNPFEENTFVLYDESGECVIVDPGCHNEAEKRTLTSFIESAKLKPVRLINTHCHLDHIFGNRYLCQKYGLPLEIHEKDLPVLRNAAGAAMLYGIPYAEPSPEPGGWLKEGDTITFGKSSLGVLFTPGHSPGHIVLVNRAQHFIIAADVLFNGSIGRTDLPGGNYDLLIKSIKEKILPLGDDFRVYPGHGPETTIGTERKYNPFLQ